MNKKIVRWVQVVGLGLALGFMGKLVIDYAAAKRREATRDTVIEAFRGTPEEQAERDAAAKRVQLEAEARMREMEREDALSR